METYYQVIEIVGQNHLPAGPQFKDFGQAERFRNETGHQYINYWAGGDWIKRISGPQMTLIFPGVVGNNNLHLGVLQTICGDTNGKSMIDLCCFHAPTTPKLLFSERTYLDIQDRKLDFEDEQQYFVLGDALQAHGHYDVSFCIDGIEHFTKENGMLLLEKMKSISDKQILFTPLGAQGVQPGTTHPDTHKSGWHAELPDWANIIFPNYHPELGCGAYYFFRCNELEQEFYNIIKQLQWIH